MKLRILSCAVLLGMAAAGRASAQTANRRAQVVFPDKTTVSVEIADTDSTRSRGLMFRERLPSNEGMIFVFDEPGEHPFWMKNTLIPLDMVWLDAGKRILHVAHSVPPCKADPCPTYPPAPGTRASFVVELASGFAKHHGLKVGDKLDITGLSPQSGANRQ